MRTFTMLMVAWVGMGVAHAGAVAQGPTGGKLLDNSPPRAEFFVNAERRVEIRFFDAELKAVPVAAQVVKVIAEAPSGKTTLTLEGKDGMLASAAALPEGDGYNVVVQIRATPDAKPQNFRVALHLETCGGCQRPEYACTCEGHGGADAHGHAH